MSGFKSKKEMAMSKIAELAYDIEQLYIDGLSAKQISKELDCPLGIVLGWIEGNSVADMPQEDASPYATINS
jgi:hypothetical protein